jgi:plastocyanin domain-containing protein
MGIKKYLFVIVVVLLTFGSAMGAEESKAIATLGDDGVQRLDVLGGSYFYKPNHIVLKADIPVELKVSKESGFIPHDIVAESPEAGIEFKEGLSTTPTIIKFTPTKVGTYPFYCSKKAPFSKSHREKGMEGVFEVVP